MNFEKNILIGTVGYPVRNKKFLSDIDVLEMDEAKHIPPGKKAAKHIKESLPQNLATIVTLSKYFIKRPDSKISLKGDANAYGDFQVTDETTKLWKRGIDFALELNATALVLNTPSHITPSYRTVTSMSSFLKNMDRNGLDIFWEPHGPWERSQMEQFARDNNLILAVDPLRDPLFAGETAYFRMGAFAAGGSRMGVYELEQIAESVAMSNSKTVYCLFDTQRALDDAKNLKDTILSLANGEDDYDEFDY